MGKLACKVYKSWFEYIVEMKFQLRFHLNDMTKENGDLTSGSGSLRSWWNKIDLNVSTAAIGNGNLLCHNYLQHHTGRSRHSENRKRVTKAGIPVIAWATESLNQIVADIGPRILHFGFVDGPTCLGYRGNQRENRGWMAGMVGIVSG